MFSRPSRRRVGIRRGGRTWHRVVLEPVATEHERARRSPCRRGQTRAAIIGTTLSRLGCGRAGIGPRQLAIYVPGRSGTDTAGRVCGHVLVPASPAEARWLTADERDWLARNAARHGGTTQRNDWSVLRQPLVSLSGLMWFCLLSGSYGVIFWLPQVISP